jgi:hypothetical protein
VGRFFGRGIVQMTLESLCVFGFGLGLGFGCIGKHFAVELVFVGDGFLRRGFV